MTCCGRQISSLALIAVLIAALGLAACGRKAGLDPPPVAGVAASEASATPVFGPAPAAQPAEAEEEDVAPTRQRSVRAGQKRGSSTRNLPPPTQAPRRSLPIDVLLN